MKNLFPLLLIVMPAGAVAAPEPDFSVRETREAVYDFARCVAKRNHDRAAKVVLEDVGNAEILRRYNRLVSGECLLKATPHTSGTVELRLAGDQFRYALADALVAVDLADVPPRDLTLVAPLKHREINASDYEAPAGKKISRREAEELADAKIEALGYFYLSRFGECVVRTDAVAAKALLMAEPTSPEEDVAFTALGPLLGNCVEAGQQFKASKAMLRGTIAVNYYRLAMAPLVPAPGMNQ